VLTDKTQAGGKREQTALAVLEENHITVYIGRSVDNALMHCKFCIIDDHLVEDGSWNFTTSANREDNILNFVILNRGQHSFCLIGFKIRNDMQFSGAFIR